jgi:hypothetical protein
VSPARYYSRQFLECSKPVYGLVLDFPWGVGDRGWGFSTENTCKTNPRSNNNHPKIEKAGDSTVTIATFGFSVTSAQPLRIPAPTPVSLQIISAAFPTQIACLPSFSVVKKSQTR